MSGIHEILGGLVVVAFIVMAILAAIAAEWTRYAMDSPGVLHFRPGLLVLQYLVGVLLLANDARNSGEHIVIALLVLIPVALQRSSARLSSQSRATWLC